MLVQIAAVVAQGLDVIEKGKEEGLLANERTNERTDVVGSST